MDESRLRAAAARLRQHAEGTEEAAAYGYEAGRDWMLERARLYALIELRNTTSGDWIRWTVYDHDGDGVAVGVGFAAEALGFLVVAVGAILLGRALRMDGSVVLKASIAIGVGVPVGMVAGGLLVGHTPSGPAALLLLGAVVIGLVGLPVAAEGL